MSFIFFFLLEVLFLTGFRARWVQGQLLQTQHYSRQSDSRIKAISAHFPHVSRRVGQRQEKQGRRLLWKTVQRQAYTGQVGASFGCGRNRDSLCLWSERQSAFPDWLWGVTITDCLPNSHPKWVKDPVLTQSLEVRRDDFGWELGLFKTGSCLFPWSVYKVNEERESLFTLLPSYGWTKSGLAWASLVLTLLSA